MNNTPYMVFAGTKSRYLAEEICKELDCELGQMNTTHFADGEFAVSYEESIRGKNVFLVQSTFPNSDNLMELLLMVDAAKRASAKSIVAVMPYFGWARQDRKDKPRVSIGAKLVADLLSVAGVSRVITMDLHADQIQGFFDIPVDHLYASMVFIPYIKSLNLEDLVIATPDVGGSKRASTYSKCLGVPLVLCHKTRAKANVVDTMQIIGEVEGKNVILVDDIVDTAGTISKAADLMIENGIEAEVKALMDIGVDLNCQCMQGIGYKEVLESISNNEPFPTELVKMRSRRYAKRQITFFKRSENLVKYNPAQNGEYEKLCKIIDNFINN